MKRMSTPLWLSMSGALVAAAVSALAITASAQTSTTSSSAGVLSTATPTTSAQKKPTTATPDMVNEAIQRSQARAAREQVNGTPQKWGSEEPFTYNPAIKNFNASQQ